MSRGYASYQTCIQEVEEAQYNVSKKKGKKNVQKKGGNAPGKGYGERDKSPMLKFKDNGAPRPSAKACYKAGMRRGDMAYYDGMNHVYGVYRSGYAYWKGC